MVPAPHLGWTQHHLTHRGGVATVKHMDQALPTTSRVVLTARGLFWAQVGVGVLAGLGATVGLRAVGRAGRWAPAAVLLVLVWLGAAVAVLLAVEHRKPLARAPLGAAGWAHHVRELRASRMEIVTAFEIERRRIERDLHDGAQQHLVAASLKVGEAAHLLDTDTSGFTGSTGFGASRQVADLLAQAQDATEAAMAALRATVAGIHPAVLSDLGLDTAVRDLADRCGVDVVVHTPHPLPPLPEAVAAAAYFLTAEALTNIAKHAPTAHSTILLAADDQLHISIVDTGAGGATVQPGHGLAGMTERLAAFGGALTLASPAGGPTSLNARLPLLLQDNQPGVVLNAAAPRQTR